VLRPEKIISGFNTRREMLRNLFFSIQHVKSYLKKLFQVTFYVLRPEKRFYSSDKKKSCALKLFQASRDVVNAKMNSFGQLFSCWSRLAVENTPLSMLTGF
jgi:hypothetical protein